MPIFRADLHIHSFLSPCGDLSMSPQNIVDKALEKGLDIIGIADHNSTRQANLVKKIGEKNGLFVLVGCEISSKEEAHCLAFFETETQRIQMQNILDKHLPNIANDEERFGYQIVVDENEDIVYEEPKLLISALDLSLDELYDIVHNIGGIFIPAHVDKKTTSLMSQLGFVPPEIKADALELTKFMETDKFLKRFPYLKKFKFLHSSDAHFIDIVGERYTEMELPSRSFENVKNWLKK
ncbi:histidinol-phosphatase [Bacteroidia bacterium]|nr:histidinol-phosphatase [Bacteroidia bacterium]